MGMDRRHGWFTSIMNDKRLGFLSFGHWYRGDAGEQPTAAEWHENR